MDRLLLVLLPGFDGTGKMFRPILPYFARSFDVQVITYPHSGSQHYSSLSTFVEALLPKDREYILVVESFSGPVAVQIAAKRHPNLQALVLCATFLSAPRFVPRSLRRALSYMAFKLPPFEFALRYFLLGSQSAQELASLMKTALAATTPRAMSARLEAMLSVNVMPLMSSVRIPTLCVQPTSDRMIRAAAQAEIASLSTKTTRIEGSHCILQSQPEKSYAAIAEFCDSLHAHKR